MSRGIEDIGNGVPARPSDDSQMSAACWKGSDLDDSGRGWQISWPPDAVESLLQLCSIVDFQDPDALASGMTLSSLRSGSGSSHVSDHYVELAQMVSHVRTALITGLGFVVATGFPTNEVGYRHAAKSFALFSALVGSLRSQNAQGHLLGHVRDVGADIRDPKNRIYQTNRRQTFHTDSTDAVGLMCINTALEGGRSMLVSVEAVYEEFKRRRPELAAPLFSPIATDRRGEVPEGERPWFEIPVLSWFEQHLTVLYQRQYIDSAQRFPEAPPTSKTTVEALDLFDEIMNEPDMHFAMDFERGDMQFVHNHSLLHDRTEFVDHENPAQRRHLLRTWMSLPGDRPLPACFKQRYGTIEIGARGGIRTPGADLCLPIDPNGC